MEKNTDQNPQRLLTDDELLARLREAGQLEPTDPVVTAEVKAAFPSRGTPQTQDSRWIEQSFADSTDS